MTGDTIFALSSGRPPAAIGVLRISGPDAMRAAAGLCGSLPPPREAGLRRLRDREGQTLDRALVLRFDGPATATGEDLVEIHCHGGRAVVAAIERTLAAAGLRRAEPGEFTRRAVEHGRIDLAQAEGLADLLSAETEGQRRAAMEAVEGQVSRAVRDWLKEVIALSAMVEAQIDFSDEDVGAIDPSLRDRLTALAGVIGAVLARPPVERWRDGVRVVLAGPPNAGKSTLLNMLSGRDAAIVSPVSGTTRDRIEVPVVRDGIPYILTDTAGLTRYAADAIERAGVRLAEDAIVSADILLWLDDGSPPDRAHVILVHPRADLPDRRSAPFGRIAVAKDSPVAVETLWQTIAMHAQRHLPMPDRLTMNARQRRQCEEAYGRLREAAGDQDPILIAEGLRGCHMALAGILGYHATEQVLDDLFQRFCIGK